MLRATGTDTFTTADLATLATLAKIQGDVGADTLTTAGLTDSMAQLNSLSFTGYGATSNQQVQGWADLLYASLIATPTSYSQTVPALYIAYNYGLYVAGNYEAWYAESGNTFLSFMEGGWKPPSQSRAWSQAVNGLLTAWWGSGGDVETGVPGNIIATAQGMGYDQEIEFEANLFDPKSWTDAAQVRDRAQPLWAAQRTCLDGLVSQTALQENDCLLLPFLLIAMCSSASTDDRGLAGTIAGLSTSSPEYAHDFFADQLVYYLLMVLADPLGNYAQTGDQLLAFIGGLVPAVPNADPGSQAMNTALTQQSKILNADSSYPMQDPYVPSIDFNTRKTDTLYALNQAWTTLSR
jgi:hypothetical protein